MDKLQPGRWLRALDIAEILFEDEGYTINYLEEIKSFILSNVKLDLEGEL